MALRTLGRGPEKKKKELVHPKVSECEVTARGSASRYGTLQDLGPGSGREASGSLFFLSFWKANVAEVKLERKLSVARHQPWSCRRGFLGSEVQAVGNTGRGGLCVSFRCAVAQLPHESNGF